MDPVADLEDVGAAAPVQPAAAGDLAATQDRVASVAAPLPLLLPDTQEPRRRGSGSGSSAMNRSHGRRRSSLSRTACHRASASSRRQRRRTSAGIAVADDLGRQPPD